MTILGSVSNSTDNIHWSVAGACRVGKVAAAAIVGRIGASDVVVEFSELSFLKVS
jgi:hypothetical protein